MHLRRYLLLSCRAGAGAATARGRGRRRQRELLLLLLLLLRLPDAALCVLHQEHLHALALAAQHDTVVALAAAEGRALHRVGHLQGCALGRFDRENRVLRQPPGSGRARTDARASAGEADRKAPRWHP
jgi:hypothetical protein